MRSDELMNIRNNIVNGNLTYATQQIREYGHADFGYDYLDYLTDLFAGDDNEIIINLSRALLRMKLGGWITTHSLTG